ncbi:MAG: ferric reductase-like transmembrane domain-containing protein [Anaerolineae bacterium]
MTRREPKRTWVLWLGTTVVLVPILIAVTSDGPPFLDGLIRAAALVGYVSVFVTSLFSLTTRQLSKFFGRSFQQLHHIFSIGGLTLLAIHGAAVAWQWRSLAVFLPDFSSVYAFFSLGGRAALWIFVITVLTALYRKAFRKQWRQIHWLNYVAFALGTVHGILIGTDFQSPAVKVLSGTMAAVLSGVFVWKRVERRRRIRTAQAKSAAARRRQEDAPEA